MLIKNAPERRLTLKMLGKTKEKYEKESWHMFTNRRESNDVLIMINGRNIWQKYIGEIKFLKTGHLCTKYVYHNFGKIMFFLEGGFKWFRLGEVKSTILWIFQIRPGVLAPKADECSKIRKIFSKMCKNALFYKRFLTTLR